MLPGARFPQPFQEWPHVGGQWPAYNVESDQAEGLEAWWPMVASQGLGTLRELVSSHATAITNSWSWSSEIGPILDINSAGFDTGVNVGTPSAWTLNVWIIPKVLTTSNKYFISLADDVTIGIVESDHGSNPNQYFVPWENVYSGVAAQVGVLTMVTLTHDGTDFRIYINGVQAASKTSDHNPLGNIHIGEYHSGAGDVDAYMGGTRAYGVAKTASEVYRFYQPSTRWELHQIPRRLWRLGAIAPPPAGQPIHLRALNVPHMRQWQPRVAS